MHLGDDRRNKQDGPDEQKQSDAETAPEVQRTA